MDIVRVRLRKPRRVLSFLCEGIALNRDDACIVHTEEGLEWGVCVLPPEPRSPEETRRVRMRVLRRATAEDAQTMRDIERQEERARDVCRRRIERHNLDMKLVDTECSYDKSRVTFHFVAENRVDFRELVRDLAHELRSRIELRHIQVRDQAKLTGGLGTCGRPLCCAGFLEEFRPISMRMAKAQNLSLNPAKISGQCGKLLCCLSYESDQYEACRKRRSDGEGCGGAPCAAGDAPRPADRREPAPRPAEPASSEAAAPQGDGAAKRKRKKKRRSKNDQA